MPEETIESLKIELRQEKDRVRILEQKLQAFELPGRIKLYYALNRNMNDLADMLNRIDMKTISIDDPKDKTMERLKIIWPSIASLASTIQILGEAAGVTGDEKKDTSRKTSFLDKFAN
jgi:hypothetical protein